MARKKKARGKKGGDVVRMFKRASAEEYAPNEWQWCRYAPNHEHIAGSWPETYKNKRDCLASAKRAQTVCPIEVE